MALSLRTDLGTDLNITAHNAKYYHVCAHSVWYFILFYFVYGFGVKYLIGKVCATFSYYFQSG